MLSASKVVVLQHFHLSLRDTHTGNKGERHLKLAAWVGKTANRAPLLIGFKTVHPPIPQTFFGKVKQDGNRMVQIWGGKTLTLGQNPLIQTKATTTINKQIKAFSSSARGLCVSGRETPTSELS